MMRVYILLSALIVVKCFSILNQKLSFSPKKTRLFDASTNIEQFKSGLAWDSHKASEIIPDVLVKSVEGNESMRRKFEMLCRSAQVQ